MGRNSPVAGPTNDVIVDMPPDLLNAEQEIVEPPGVKDGEHEPCRSMRAHQPPLRMTYDIWRACHEEFKHTT